MSADNGLEEQTDIVKVELVRPGFFTPKVVSSLIGIPIGVLFGATYAIYHNQKYNNDVLPETVLFKAVLICAVAIAFILVYRFTTRPTTGPVIEFKQNFVSLPLNHFTMKTIDVEYKNIRSIGYRGWVWGKLLVVDTKNRLFPYLAKRFIQSDAPKVLRSEIRKGLERLKDGAELIAAMDRREDTGAAFRAKKKYATWTLFFLIGVVFIIQVILSAYRGPMIYIGMGANASVLVFHGQWYRLISANFLHGGFLHLFCNGIALLFLGALVERMVGWQRFLIIFILSAIGGSLASALMQRAVFSVGASTAIFGLLGAFLALHVMYWSMLPAGFRQSFKWWFLIILITGLEPVLAPQIDIAAHAGGFLVGAASAWLICRSDKILQAGSKPGKPILIATALTSIVCLAGLSIAAVNAVNPDKSDEIKFIDELISNVEISEGILNNLAWYIAIDPDASLEHLEVAEKAAGQAVERAPDESVSLNRDTLATVFYRQGRLDDAVLMQLKALQGEIEEREKKGMYSQMARFLRAENDRDGVMLRGDVKLEDVSITWTKKDDTTNKPRIRVEFEEKLKTGATVLAHLEQGGKPIGILMVRWRLKKKARISRSPDYAENWPEDAELKIGFIKEGRGIMNINASRLNYYDLDPEVMERP